MIEHKFYKKGITCRTCSGISWENNGSWLSNGSQNESGNVHPFYKISTAYKTLGDFSIVPHFEVTSNSRSAFVTRTSFISEQSGRTSMSMGFGEDLISDELRKNSSDHYKPWSYSPSFATRVIEKDVYNVHNTIGLLPKNPSIDYSENALKTQYSDVLVTNEDNKIDQRHFHLRSLSAVGGKSPSLTSKAGVQLVVINENIK